MDLSWIDTVIGAAVTLVAYKAGQRRERRREPKAKQPICGCSHHRSYHQDGKGECMHEYLHYGNPVKCTCQGYHGPKTLDDLIPED